MKKFIINFIVLCLILLFVSVIIEVALLYKTNTYSYKHKYIITHLEDIKVLFMGNSHIMAAIMPDSMDNGVFNAAIYGRSVDYDVKLIKQYVPQLKNLKTLVMPLDYFSFYFGRDYDNPNGLHSKNNMTSTYKCMYYKYMNVPDNVWSWSELLNSRMNYMTRFLKSEEENRECDSLGYDLHDLSSRKVGWETKALPRLVETTKPIDKEIYNKLVNDYRIIADIAKKSDIRLILIETPFYKSYQKYMNQKVCQEIDAFVTNLKEEYPEIDYYDFSRDNRFEADDFYDSEHLSNKGAAKFSKIMNEIINNDIGFVSVKRI